MIRDFFQKISTRGSRSGLPSLPVRYSIARELGRGGMAVVYLARDRQLDRDVAIKVMQPTLSEDRTAVARLANEARILAQLHHPNIVAIHDLQTLRDGSVALVMQYVRGRTLRQLIDADGELPIAFVQQVLGEVASALAAAHRRGIIHRDVKPENIYIEEDTGRALLADFGIARSSRLEVGLTLHDEVLGTPHYMSPEQIAGGDLDARSDLYSLALVGHEMLTGKRPWGGESLYQVLHKQQHEQLPPLRASRTDLPTGLENALHQALRKERLDRPETGEHFISLMRREVVPDPGRGAGVSRTGEEDPEAKRASASAPTVRYHRRGAVEGEGSPVLPASSVPPSESADSDPLAAAPAVRAPRPEAPEGGRWVPTPADSPRSTTPESRLQPVASSPPAAPPSTTPQASRLVRSELESQEADPLVGLSRKLKVQASHADPRDGKFPRLSPRTARAAGVVGVVSVTAILVVAIGLPDEQANGGAQAASPSQVESTARMDGEVERPVAPQSQAAPPPVPAPAPTSSRGGGGAAPVRRSNLAKDYYRPTGDITDIFCQPRENETVDAWRARVPTSCQMSR